MKVKTGPFERFLVCVVSFSVVACLLVQTVVRATETPQAPAEQQSVAEVAGDLEQRLVELLLLEEADSPEKARRLRVALQTLRELTLSEKAQRAAELLRQGHRAEALVLEKEVAKGLREVLAALSSPQYEAQIADYRKFRSELAALARAQRKEGEETGKQVTDDQKARDAAYDRQRELKLTASHLGRRMEQNVPPVPGAGEVGQAAASMQEAMGRIDQGQMSGAQGAQRKAESKLDEALKKLDKAIEELREKQRQESLARLKQLLAAMLEKQRAVSARTARLRAAAGKSQALSAADAKTAAALAGDEAALAESAGEVKKLLAEDGSAPVFSEGIDRAASLLREAQGRLAEQKLDAALASAQQNAEALLAAMLEAVKEGGGPKPAEAQAQKGEKDEKPQAGRQPLVKAQAELKLLQFLQKAVLADTAQVDKAPAQKERSLKELQLGRRESKLRSAADRLAAGLPPLKPVAEEMALAQKSLQAGQTGQDCQATQQRVVDALGRLIAAMNESTSKGGAPRPAPGRQAGGHPSSPAAVSTAAQRDWRYGSQGQEARADAWLTGLPPRQREIIERSFESGDVPARYKALIKRYNKRLAGEEN